MTFARSAIAAAALLLASQAHASLVSFSLAGRADYTQGQGGLAGVYPAGTPISGTFTFDDAVPPRLGTPDYQDYSGNYSGVVHVGGNTITVGDSYSYVWNAGTYTELVLLGGDAWNTGGAVTESQAPAGFSLQGLQIMLGYAPGNPVATPPAELVANHLPLTTSLYLNYGNGEGVWGTVTAVGPLQGTAPEPGSLALVGMGCAAFLGRRRRAS